MGVSFDSNPMAFVDMSCYLLGSSCHGHLCTSLSKMLWMRLSNVACEFSSFHGLLCTAVSGTFSGSHIALSYAVDCLGTRLASFFPEMPHRATNPPIAFTAVMRAQLLFSHSELLTDAFQTLPGALSPPHRA